MVFFFSFFFCLVPLEDVYIMDRVQIEICRFLWRLLTWVFFHRIVFVLFCWEGNYSPEKYSHFFLWLHLIVKCSDLILP